MNFEIINTIITSNIETFICAKDGSYCLLSIIEPVYTLAAKWLHWKVFIFLVNLLLCELDSCLKVDDQCWGLLKDFNQENKLLIWNALGPQVLNKAWR